MSQCGWSFTSSVGNDRRENLERETSFEVIAGEIEQTMNAVTTTGATGDPARRPPTVAE
jgi:hypothetical protein